MEIGPGATIEKYEIAELLGEGGMARVFKARHTLLGSEHAIKVLDPQLVANDDLRARFLAEGRIQAQLRHPAIVAVTDVIAVPGVAALVAEFVDGPPLDVWIDEHGGTTAPAAIRDVFLPLLDGLGHAHASGVVHRDIKPANILLARSRGGGQVPKIVDFGIAKVAAESMRGGTGRTRTGAVMGTLAYMSPEQIKGSGDIDHRTDIFSLAATLYEFVTGEVPFEGETDYDTMKQIVEGAPRPLRERVGDLDPAIASCIERGLASAASDRFQSCEEFATALRGMPVARPGPESIRAPFAGSSWTGGEADLGPAPPSAVDTMSQGLSALGQGAAALAREGGQLASQKAAELRQRRVRGQEQKRLISYEEPPHHPLGPALLNLICIPGMGHAVYKSWGRLVLLLGLSVVAFVIDAVMMEAWVYEAPFALFGLKVWSAFDVWKIGKRLRAAADS